MYMSVAKGDIPTMTASGMIGGRTGRVLGNEGAVTVRTILPIESIRKQQAGARSTSFDDLASARFGAAQPVFCKPAATPLTVKSSSW
jgi:hypothetical protein